MLMNANRDTLSFKKIITLSETTTCHHSLVVFEQREAKTEMRERVGHLFAQKKSAELFVATTLSLFTSRSIGTHSASASSTFVAQLLIFASADHSSFCLRFDESGTVIVAFYAV